MSFALKAKTAVKHVTALSAGAVMLGATIAGAAAQAYTLADYPAPFIQNGRYNMLPVVGRTALAADTIGLTDIMSGLAAGTTSGTTGGTGAVVVTGGETDEVMLGSNITGAGGSTTLLDSSLDDDDIESFIDTEITFAGSSYDVHDELDLGFQGGIAGNTSTVRPVTSLLANDDDFESSIFFEAKRGSLGYFYVVDETIKLNSTTTSDAFEIQFLGKNLKIIEITSDTKFKAYVGDEYFMNVGDRVTSQGKTVTLENVGQSSVLVDVDGVKATITNGGTKTVNGVEITVDELFYRTQIESSSANLVVGKDSSEEIQNGEEYFGGDDSCNDDPDDPDCWVWVIQGLYQNKKGDIDVNINTGPTIGLKNDFNVVNDDDNPPAVGDCINLPNNYASICLDSLSVADTDYSTYSIRHESNADLSDSGLAGVTSVPVVVIEAKEGSDDGIVLRTLGWNIVRGGFVDATETDKVYLYLNVSDVTSRVWVFYDDTENNQLLAGALDSDPSARFAQLDYQDTKGTNVELNLIGVEGAWTSGLNISLFTTGDEAGTHVGRDKDNLMVYVANNAVGFTGFGRIIDDAESLDLSWSGTAFNNLTLLGTKDEDHRTSYGIIIRDPESGFDTDEFTFELPADQVFANVVVKGTSTTVSSGGGAGGGVAVSGIAPPAVFDSEVTVPERDNLLLVGGPVVNKITARFTGSTWTYRPGEAIIELYSNGANIALVVAGTDAADTRRASRVMRDYTRHKSQLVGKSVKVVGSSQTFTDTVVTPNF